MQIKQITTNPFNDQKPGTSGLRKKAKLLTDTPSYLENYVQAIFNVADVKGKTYVLACFSIFQMREQGAKDTERERA